MRGLNQRIKACCLLMTAGILICFIITDLLLIRNAYRNYRDKIYIISSMISGQENNKDNIETASELLKNKDYDVQYGLERLKQYGYLSGVGNAYQAEYKRELLLILTLSPAALYYRCHGCFLHMRTFYREQKVGAKKAGADYR